MFSDSPASDQLGILLPCKFQSASAVGPEILHFSQSPGGRCSCFVDTLEQWRGRASAAGTSLLDGAVRVRALLDAFPREERG